MCLLVKYDTCTNNSNTSYAINEAQHIPSGYSISILDNSTNSSKVLYYREKDCVQKLCKELREIGEELFDTVEKPMIPLTPEQKRFHNNAKRCHICQYQFYSENHVGVKSTNYRKAKDHDHYTGIYRGAAHSICNLRYSTQRDIFVVIHNGTNYDFHLITKELAEEFRTEIQCIPEDKEKYKSFSIPIMYKECNDYTIPYNLRFIDSNKFMMGSLDSHVNNLSELYSCNCSNKSNQQIKIKHNDKNIYTRCKTCTKRSKQSVESLKLKFPNTYQLTNGNIEKFILLFKKGVYPYEYMDSWNRFEEEELPSMDEFFSNLKLKNISKEDYKHAQKVKNAFNIKNLGEYHDLYVQSDTSQLADTFEQFRTLCLFEYKLDPAYFCTTPGLAFEACLKMTKVELGLLPDIGMVLLFEKRTRAGISQAIQRYASANNKYKPNYNSKVLSTYLMYEDANNLYGWTMAKKLPINNFKWCDALEMFTSDFIRNYDEDSHTRYLLEITDYPKELHESHRDLPFLSIKKEKLLTTLENKQKYVVHIPALKQALLHGLEF